MATFPYYIGVLEASPGSESLVKSLCVLQTELWMAAHRAGSHDKGNSQPMNTLKELLKSCDTM
jgi:hypothetical protein